MPTVDGICEANVLAAAERHFNGPCGTCHTCRHGYSCEHSELMTGGDESYLREFDELYLVCLADPHDPCVVRKDEVHDDCWEAV